MGILELASKLSEIVYLVAKEKGITKEEAWDEGVEIFKNEYEYND